MTGFCIDETEFAPVDDVVVVTRRLNDLLTVIHRRSQQVYKSTELDFIEILDGVELCDLLYKPELGLLDNDDRLLLMNTLNRCIGLDGVDFEIPNGEVRLAGKPVESEATLFAISKALTKEAIGVIHPKPLERLGPLEATVGELSTKLFHVGLALPLEKFYRFMMAFEEVNQSEFSKWTNFAFERLRFALNPSSQIGRFRQRYQNIREEIIKHLSAINDEFVSMLIAGRKLSDICNSVGAKCGVEISPESPNTHRNKSAMKEREVDFEGKTVVCEFHSKLTPTHDRIHFSPVLRETQDKRTYVVVGPFAEHLTT